MAYGQNKKDFWRASSVAFEDIYRREINYCGLASMSWMYYYNGQTAFTLAAMTRASCDGCNSRHKRQYAIAVDGPWLPQASPCAPRRKLRHGRICACGVQQRLALWRADIPQLIAPYLDFDHNPDYLQDEYALNQCYNFKRRDNIEHRFEEIPAPDEAGANWDVRHMFIAAWNRTGFDSFTRNITRIWSLAAPWNLRRGLEYVREHGGFSTFVHQRAHLRFEIRFPQNAWRKMAIRTETGEMRYETYGPEHFTVNCPSDKLWREFLWIRRNSA